VVTLAASIALVEGAESPRQKPARKKPAQTTRAYIPKDLEDCFAQLDKILTDKDRQEIASKSEEDLLLEYHFGWGTGLRNDWGLWAHSRLAKYFEELGVDHPEEMSSIIIKSYWRRLNHQDIKLEGQVAEYRADVEKEKKEQEVEKERVVRVFHEIPRLMLGYTYNHGSVPVVTMPRRNKNELRARFIAPFDNGIFITAREFLGNSGLASTYKLVPYLLDRDQMIHAIRIPEIKDILDAVIVGDWSWFVGKNKENGVLLAIKGSERKNVALPRSDEIPQLGISGDNLLLVYSKSVLRRTGDDWETLYSGDIKLPWSGPPPRHYGDKIYFRDEGSGENQKRLWVVELKNPPRLVSVAEDTGLVGPNGPRWENSFSYCVTRDGTLWTTFGEGYAKKSLVCRKPDGDYRIATINDDIQFRGGLFGEDLYPEGSEQTAITLDRSKRSGELPNRPSEKSGPSISAIVEASENELIGVGDKGLYRISNGQITRLLAFKNTHQSVPYGKSFLQWEWDPSNILILGDDNYLISGAFGGIYSLNRHKDEWRFHALDQKLGEPVVW